MSFMEDLLSNVPKEDLDSYQAYLHTHLKVLMTSINKARVQDITPVLIRKNKCIDQCYRRGMRSLQSKEWEQEAYDTVEQIRECKQRCGEEKKAVKKYLDDINYYSSLKLEGCSKKCSGGFDSKEYNQCYWICLNKLDRRYKRYWMEQRELVSNRFKE